MAKILIIREGDGGRESSASVKVQKNKKLLLNYSNAPIDKLIKSVKAYNAGCIVGAAQTAEQKELLDQYLISFDRNLENIAHRLEYTLEKE